MAHEDDAVQVGVAPVRFQFVVETVQFLSAAASRIARQAGRWDRRKTQNW